MAVINMLPNGAGGQLIEHVLWTNPNPTQVFGAQTKFVSASEVMNYQYVRIAYLFKTDKTSIHYVYASVEQIFNYNDAVTSNSSLVLTLGGFVNQQDEAGYRLISTIYNPDSDSLAFHFRNTYLTLGGQDASYMIPLEIVGLSRIMTGEKNIVQSQYAYGKSGTKTITFTEDIDLGLVMFFSASAVDANRPITVSFTGTGTVTQLSKSTQYGDSNGGLAMYVARVEGVKAGATLTYTSTAYYYRGYGVYKVI